MRAALQRADAEPSGFAQVYREHNGFAWQALRSLGVPEASVDDAVQDVFFVVHRRLGEFEGRAAMRTWLYEIVRRVGWRYRTRAQQDAARNVELPELRGADDLDAAVDRSRAFELLQEFTSTLDEDRLRVFMLSEFGQLRGREIAGTLDVNLNTVYARLRSAHQQLDRLTTRLRAREAGTLLASARGIRPRPAAVRRTWAALALQVGIVQPTVIVATGGWLAQLGWTGVGGAVAAVGVATLVAVAPDPPLPTPAPRRAAQEVVGSMVDAPRATRMLPPVVAWAAVPVPKRQAAPAAALPPAVAPVPSIAVRAAAVADPTGTTLAEEVALVQQIRRRFRRREGTDTLLRTYREKFPSGALREEVEALAIEQACTEGQNVAPRVAAFSERWPRSGLLARLKKTCGEQFGPQKPGGGGTQSL